MSTEDEIELKELITQTLEANGCLPKLKAQLRSNLYLSLHDDIKISNLKPLLNKKIRDSFDSPNGKIMFSIVREFLEFFALDFTLSVFESESYLGKNYVSRSKLVEELDIHDDTFSSPILLQIIQSFAKIKAKIPSGPEKSLSQTVENDEISNSLDKNAYIDGDINLKGKLNATFTVNNENNIDNKNLLESTSSKNDNEPITYDSFIEGASKSNQITDLDDCDTETSFKSNEKSRLSLKTEKVKSKNVFSCLPDLSPLQNKSRVSDILPSLYSKDLKEKSNLQELDKMFDMKVDYEEDFICSGQDLSESYLTSEIANDTNKDTNRDINLSIEKCSEVASKNKIEKNSVNMNFTL